MVFIALLTVATMQGAFSQGTSKAYPPGWNKEAVTPPMGWRSWNAFGARIDEKTFTSAIDALIAPVWQLGGGNGNFSLADLGYARVGIDEGWENCSGSDPNHGLRQHDADGFPMINTDKFPDFKRLVDYGHAHNISMGWYLNGCACGERKEREVNYKGDVQRLHEFGFDSVKLDGCGAATNMTKYAEYMAETGKSYGIENCHWGHCGSDSWYHNPDGSSCPTQAWAPFNWFRTSGDINSGALSWFNNLQTTVKFLDYDAPLAKPGVWAYPDMLEVGRVAEPAPGTFYGWNRAHFGAWCIISSPLVLGMDLTDIDKIKPIIDVISNKEAISVNQQWAGHPGMLVEQIVAPSPQRPTDSLECFNKTAGGAGPSYCNGKYERKYDATTAQDPQACAKLCLDDDSCIQFVWGQNEPPSCRTSSTCTKPYSISSTWDGYQRKPDKSCTPTNAGQLWAKPQLDGAIAAFVLNHSPNPLKYSIDFKKLNLTDTTYNVRDIWTHTNNGTASGHVDVSVPGYDSVLLLLSPSKVTVV